MKPAIFKSQEDLMNFLQSCPTPEGEAKVQGEKMEASAMLARCIELVPKIFEYKDVLAMGAGGLGSKKSVFRYVDAASDNVSREKLEAFSEAVSGIEAEVETLLESGASDELTESLRGARTKIARFNLIKASIEGFRDKLNKYMNNVEETYLELSQELNKKKRELSKTLDSEQVELLIKEVSDKHKTVVGLVSAMNEYCALQVGYNGICLG